MGRDKTSVHHWAYNDGQQWTTNYVEFRPEIVGWHCWVYPSDRTDFETWMKENMKGVYDCTYRFNSGDPMYTVFIRDDEDATFFKLKWNT
jgi:hypothetical protein